MLLAIDIGNSTLGVGLFLDPQKKAVSVQKIPSNLLYSSIKSKKIILDLLKMQGINPNSKLQIDIILTSVVPALTNSILKATEYLSQNKPLVVDSQFKSGFIFRVPTPELIGVDRLANAMAGWHLFKKPFVVADFGTATTLTVIGQDKDFLGGAILPGLYLMQEVLHKKTANLPKVDIDIPHKIVGQDTKTSINSGIIFGTVGAVEYLVKEMERQLGFRLRLIITGGYSNKISPLIKKRHVVEPNLIFEGLRYLYLANR